MLRILAFVICMLPFTASANVMTLDGYYQGYGTPVKSYSEDGITATSNLSWGGLEGYGSLLLLEPGTTSTTGEITFTMEKRFNAVSADLSASVTRFCQTPEEQQLPDCEHFNDPFDIMYLEGYRDDTMVAHETFFGNMDFFTYYFGYDFQNLDALVIGLNSHPYRIFAGDNETFGYVDNITLSPVPLPAALPLYGAGLALMGFVGWRGKRKSKSEFAAA